MKKACDCHRCLHPKCPPINASLPYDEISHEVHDNIISVRIPKSTKQIRSETTDKYHCQEQPVANIDVNCVDPGGKKCKEDCTKVNVMPNQVPPAKRPEEEMFSLRTIRQIMPNDDLKNTLEIEFKASRNYIPLPDLGPPPPVIVPRHSTKAKKGKPKSNGTRKK